MVELSIDGRGEDLQIGKALIEVSDAFGCSEQAGESHRGDSPGI